MIKDALDAAAGTNQIAAAAAAGGLVSTDERRQNNNIHWLEDELGEPCDAPSRYVAYYDAASLYPSSGAYLRLPLRERSSHGQVRIPTRLRPPPKEGGGDFC